MRRAPSRASSSRLIVSSLRAASSVTTLNMSRRSFLAGGGAPASFQHGQGGRYAAFSCQGLIHRFRRYLDPLNLLLELCPRLLVTLNLWSRACRDGTGASC